MTREFDEFIRQAVEQCRDTDEIEGLAVGGSIGRGDNDPRSDLDLFVYTGTRQPDGAKLLPRIIPGLLGRGHLKALPEFGIGFVAVVDIPGLIDVFFISETDECSPHRASNSIVFDRRGEFTTWNSSHSIPTHAETIMHNDRTVIDLVTYVTLSWKSLVRGDELGAIYRLERARSLISGFCNYGNSTLEWWDTHTNKVDRINAIRSVSIDIAAMIPFRGSNTLESAIDSAIKHVSAICAALESTESIRALINILHNCQTPAVGDHA